MILDFTTPQTIYRLKHISRRNEYLLRALGKVKPETTSIIDTTSGMGQDSLLMAAAGFHVLMLERSANVYDLLQNALNHAANHPMLTSCISRLTLLHIDAVTYLQQYEKPVADIIYLDPMFPAKQKNAASKKSMQFLQQLLQDDSDNTQELFNMALTCAKKRVVVKRPRLALPITTTKSSFSIVGKSSRFDIYIKCE